MNDAKTFVQTLAQNTNKFSMNEFFKTVHSQFYYEVDISFMDYFLELTTHESEFVVHHSKLTEYGIVSSKKSNDIKDRLDSLGLIEDIDYNLRDVPQVRKERGYVVKKVYNLSPEAFKKCLMRAQRRPNQTVDPVKYCDYYLLLEKIHKLYSEYEKTVLEQELIQKDQQLDQKELQLKETNHQLDQNKLQLHKQELYSNKLKDIVINIKARQKDQIIYIATTAAYAKQNRFKVGGVKSVAHLKSRLSTYNSGRPAGDKMYYAFFTEITDYKHLEQRISTILNDHKDTKEAEMYNVHYDSLQPLVEYLADRFDEEVQHHRSLFEQLIKDTFEKPPTVPPPIILNGAEFRTFRDGKVVSVQKIDFDTMNETDKVDYVKKIFDEFLLFHATKDEFTRQEFEEFVVRDGTKFSKRALWGFTKRVAQEMQKSIKY
jgi:hypothetical protein